MKLNDVRPNVETSGELEEQFFSIQDQGMIFDILRNKMYSNPILAISREISCNARDAHREVNKSDLPIEIQLPTPLEPFYKIKDFGPGISPDRMSNIFIKYTASTKRDDNTQTGGFGLGAKTPFSYSDTFTIITNFNGKKYNYACFIDETRVGKLVLFSTEDTTDPNGTEIVIPVKPIDFRAFNEWTEFSTKHWAVKPIIRGGKIDYKEPNKILEGSNWVITAATDWQRTIKIIIDGIEYPVDLNTLKTYADAKLIESTTGNIFLYFGIGELTLSASREQIYLDKSTQDKINKRLSAVVKEIKNTVLTKIDTFTNLWEANIFYRSELQSVFHSLDFLGKLTWQNIELNNGYTNLECPVFMFVKGGGRYGSDPNKIRRSHNRHLSFSTNSLLYINDLDLNELSARHVKRLFDEDPKLGSVQVVCPTAAVSLESLNKKIHLDRMDPEILSSITKASTRKVKKSTSRLLLFKFFPSQDNGNFKQIPIDSFEEDKNKKILCRLVKSDDGFKSIILADKKQISPHIIKSISARHKSYSIYGVDTTVPEKRIEEDLPNTVEFEVFIKKFLDDTTINYVEIKYAQNNHYSIDDHLINMYSSIVGKIADPNSLFLKRIILHEKIKKLSSTDLDLLGMYENIKGIISNSKIDDLIKNNPELNMNEMKQNYEKKYPLITHINTYNYRSMIDHIIQYVNLIDKI